MSTPNPLVQALTLLGAECRQGTWPGKIRKLMQLMLDRPEGTRTLVLAELEFNQLLAAGLFRAITSHPDWNGSLWQLLNTENHKAVMVNVAKAMTMAIKENPSRLEELTPLLESRFEDPGFFDDNEDETQCEVWAYYKELILMALSERDAALIVGDLLDRMKQTYNISDTVTIDLQFGTVPRQEEDDIWPN